MVWTFLAVDRTEQNGLTGSWSATVIVAKGSVVESVRFKFHREPSEAEVIEKVVELITHRNRQAEVASLIEFAKSGNDPRLFQFEAITPLEGFRELLKYLIASASVDAMPLVKIAKGYTVEGLVVSLGVNVPVAQAIVDWIAQLANADQAIRISDQVRVAIAAEIN